MITDSLKVGIKDNEERRNREKKKTKLDDISVSKHEILVTS